MKKELELYELVLLVKFTTTEQETIAKIDSYRDFFTGKGSQVMVKNHGKISLAYPIKGFDSATYIQLVYLGNGNLIKELNTQIQRDESILRSITTKLVEQNTPEVFASAI
jgi:ribosomal protein S6